MRIFAIAIIALYFLTYASSVRANPNIKINEFLAHASSGNKEWVEFYNPDHLDLSTYWLDDDTDFANDEGNSNKKSLVNLNNTDPIHPFLEFDSFLNNGGDYVVLFSGDGVIVDQYQYTDDPGLGVTIGRWPDGSGDLKKLESATKGSANSSPLPSPTPTPTPQATPTPTPKPSPSPSPSPTKSPIPAPKTSPQYTPAILGETDQLSSPSSSIASSHSPNSTPTPNLLDQSPSKIKIASILIGSGGILIGLSIGFYLWYKRVLKLNIDKNKDQL